MVWNIAVAAAPLSALCKCCRGCSAVNGFVGMLLWLQRSVQLCENIVVVVKDAAVAALPLNAFVRIAMWLQHKLSFCEGVVVVVDNDVVAAAPCIVL